MSVTRDAEKMAIANLLNVSLLMLVIRVSAFIPGCRKLREAEAPAAKLLRALDDCERAGRELQEFTLLFNYGARQEAYKYLPACGVRMTEATEGRRAA
jgi:hypothetical protein